MVRYPKCNRYGNPNLGGYCKTCKEARRKPNYIRRNSMKSNYGFQVGDRRFPDKYGIVRDEFEIVDKGKENG